MLGVIDQHFSGECEVKIGEESMALVKTDLVVGITDEINSTLKIATAFTGLKPSQYGRLAILEKLVRDGYMKHPGDILVAETLKQAAE